MQPRNVTRARVTEVLSSVRMIPVRESVLRVEILITKPSTDRCSSSRVPAVTFCPKLYDLLTVSHTRLLLLALLVSSTPALLVEFYFEHRI